ncbi:tetratricopeptide repeat protein [Zavarzinia compransoris]|nr:tetratricopeptide repeat protein [Zavarzinia marina]
MFKSLLTAAGLAFSLAVLDLSAGALAAEIADPAAGHRALGEAASAAGDHASAIRHLSAAMVAGAEGADLESLIGRSFQELGNLREAKRHFERALALAPDHLEARARLGSVFLGQGRIEKAEEQLAALGRLCPAGCAEFTDLRAAVAAYRVVMASGA